MAKPVRKPRADSTVEKEDSAAGELGALQIVVSGNPVLYDLMSEIQVDRDDLKTSVLEQPSKFAFIASVHAAYEGALVAAEIEVKRLYSSLYISFNDNPLGDKKPTVPYIEACIQDDPKYKDAVDRKVRLEKMVAKLRACVEAFRHRKDMLISATAIYRYELDADLTKLKTRYAESMKS